MCRLFNDNEFDIFIDSYAKQLGYHQNFIEKLKRLREMLNSYNEDDNKSDIEVINSQNWQKIADYAKLIIKEWNMDKLSFE